MIPTKKQIMEQEITEAGGLIEGVFITREAAINMIKSVRSNMERMKENEWANRLSTPSVKLYIEALEYKINQAENVANFPIKKKN